MSHTAGLFGLKDLVGTSVVVTVAEQRGELHPQKLKHQQQQQSEGWDATVPPTARLTGEVRCRHTEHQSWRRNQIKKKKRWQLLFSEICTIQTIPVSPLFTNSAPRNSRRGRDVTRDGENGSQVHVKPSLCKCLTGDDDKLMKSLTNRCTASQQQTERPRQTKTERRNDGGS